MEQFAQRLLLTLPRRRSLCHAAVLYDALTFAMGVRTRDALVEYVRKQCTHLPPFDDDDDDDCAASVKATADKQNIALTKDERRRSRRVSEAAASLNSPRLSTTELLVSLDNRVVLHFLMMLLREVLETLDDDAAANPSAAWEDLLTEMRDHFSFRRSFSYLWVVVDVPPVQLSSDTITCSESTQSKLPATTPPTVLLALPADVSACIESAFSSGRTVVFGNDWDATISSDPRRCTLSHHAYRSRAPLFLARQCSLDRRPSRYSAAERRTSTGPVTSRSTTPRASVERHYTAMNTGHPGSDQFVHWSLLTSWAASSDSFDPCDAAVSSILERALNEWRESGECGVEFSSPYGEQGTWVHPSSTQLWELEFAATTSLSAPSNRRCRVLREVCSSGQYQEDNDVADDAPQPASSVRLHPLAELYLAMARGAAAGTSDDRMMGDGSTTINNSCVAEEPTETTTHLMSRYDSPALQPDVMCVVAPLLLDNDAVIPLTSEPDPPLAAVVCALQLPFIDPNRFIWSSEAFYQDSGPLNSATRGPLCFEHAEQYEHFYEGCWVPMVPVNEWLIAHGHQRLFLLGVWYAYHDGVARRIVQQSAEHHYHHHGSDVDDNSFLWVRRKTENPIRMICQGVPLSLDRRVLMDSTCPEALLHNDVVIVDHELDPREVQRTWMRGDRGYLKVLEYFSLRGGASQGKSTFKQPRSGTQQLVEDAHGNASLCGNMFGAKAMQMTHAQLAEVADKRKAAVGTLLNSSSGAKYQYKFPVLPSAL
jgi:hypothetical protein